jgi:outer membrane receptor for ferric coprogen and ferric-rhodotorulic acid
VVVITLGISKNKFNKLDWENFDWQTRNLHKNLTHFFADETVFLLPFLNDINSSSHLRKQFINFLTIVI